MYEILTVFPPLFSLPRQLTNAVPPGPVPEEYLRGFRPYATAEDALRMPSLPLGLDPATAAAAAAYYHPGYLPHPSFAPYRFVLSTWHPCPPRANCANSSIWVNKVFAQLRLSSKCICGLADLGFIFPDVKYSPRVLYLWYLFSCWREFLWSVRELSWGRRQRKKKEKKEKSNCKNSSEG